jgi:hypothetical protein
MTAHSDVTSSHRHTDPLARWSLSDLYGFEMGAYPYRMRPTVSEWITLIVALLE